MGLALEDAVIRQAVRDVCAMSGRSELVLSSITGSGLVARSREAELTHVVIGASIVGAAAALVSLADAGIADVLVVSDDPADTVERLGVSRNQIIEAKSDDPQRVAKQIVGALDRRPAHVRPSHRLPRVEANSTSDEPGMTTLPAVGRTVLAIGCSTGGPEALTTILTDFPADFPVPVVIVQHMPPDFTAVLAQTLSRVTPLDVREVTGPTMARPGEVWIAPGHRHLVAVDAAGRLDLDDGPEVKNCRPSVDVLFRSIARTHGRGAVAAVLTGMGNDGEDGAADLVAAGGHMIVQDESSSVVWGMPGAIARAGNAHDIVSLPNMAKTLQAPFGAMTNSPHPTKECHS